MHRIEAAAEDEKPQSKAPEPPARPKRSSSSPSAAVFAADSASRTISKKRIAQGVHPWPEKTEMPYTSSPECAARKASKRSAASGQVEFSRDENAPFILHRRAEGG